MVLKTTSTGKKGEMTKVTDDCFAVFVCLIIRDEIIWSFCLLGLNVRKFAEIPTAEHLAGIFALGMHQFGNAAVPHRGERMVPSWGFHPAELR
ncbi:MAG: hypothetical protein ACLUD2_08430 [Clostridium sp.]